MPTDSTLLVLFMVDIFFDISPAGADCDSPRHLAEMLLPCTKNLWSARTRSEWKKEYTSQSRLQSYNDYRRLTFGNLSQHDLEDSPCGDLLDHWLAQVDELGTLIMAAAKLSEPY